jgi:MFS transporter, DHA2 family, multidrug resistance protein
LGFLFIAIAIAAAQLMLDRGQRNDWFDSLEITMAFVLAVGFFYLFVVHMLTARQPLFEAATFRDRNFVIGLLVALIMGMLQYTPMVLFPPLLQDLRGYPEAVIGYLLATRGIGNFCAFFVVAQFTRYDARLCLFTGLTIQALAALWMGTLDMNMTTEDVLLTNILHGFGHGLSYTPMAILSFSTLPPHLLTQGNSIFSLLRMLGSSIFISMTVLVFVHSAAEASVSLSSFVNVFRLDAMPEWVAAYGEPEGKTLYARLAAEIYRQSSMIGYINAFHLMTIVPALTAPLAFLFVRRRRLEE